MLPAQLQEIMLAAQPPALIQVLPQVPNRPPRAKSPKPSLLDRSSEYFANYSSVRLKENACEIRISRVVEPTT
jgi:hypothetical protein